MEEIQEFLVFGVPSLRLDDAAVHLSGRKQMWLLTLRHGREVPRDCLASMLWPESGEKQVSLPGCRTTEAARDAPPLRGS